MAEPCDETDGTPEWAKRMFRNLRVARWRLFLAMLFVGLPVYGAYRVWHTAVEGRIWIESGNRWITYHSEPGRFMLEVGASAIGIIAPLLVVFLRAKYPEWLERVAKPIRPR